MNDNIKTDRPASRDPVALMRLRVRYHECDPQGIVFHAHYLAYADMASFEAFAALFGSYKALHRHGVDVVVAEANVRYLAPCRFGDDLTVAVFVERVGTTSLVLRFDIDRCDEDSATPAAVVTNRYVWVDVTTMRPTPPPAQFRERLTQVPQNVR